MISKVPPQQSTQSFQRVSCQVFTQCSRIGSKCPEKSRKKVLPSNWRTGRATLCMMFLRGILWMKGVLWMSQGTLVALMCGPSTNRFTKNGSISRKTTAMGCSTNRNRLLKHHTFTHMSISNSSTFCKKSEVNQLPHWKPFKKMNHQCLKGWRVKPA